MKYSLVALAATSIFGGASARGHLHNRRHNHPFYGSSASETCIPQCTTYVTSYLVDYTPPPQPAPSHPAPSHPAPSHPVELQSVAAKSSQPPQSTSSHSYSPHAAVTATATAYAEYTVTSYSTTAVTATYHPLITPAVTTYPTPGVYTISPQTVTLTSTDYICAPTTTYLAPGTHIIGGVTTYVETKTTFICPVPAIVTAGDVTTSKIILTTYECPTPGTYTINPITTTITATTTVPCEYPTVSSYPPGIYTAPKVTTTVKKPNEVVTCPYYTSTSTATVVPIAPTETPSHTEAPKDTVTPYHPEVTSAKALQYTKAPEASSAEAPQYTKAPEAPKQKVSIESHNESHNDNSAKVTEDNNNYVPKNDIWGITYSPYNDDSTCKSAGDVDSDIQDIASKGFKTLRLYSTDCNGLETVGNSCGKYGLKIVLGIFIKAGGVHTADSQVDDIITWNRWDLVEIFVVGNEAIFQGFCSAQDLAAYISEVKQKIQQAGYSGPVTTTEPLNIYQENNNYQTICDVCDVVGINIHPYFNADVTCDQAGPFLSQELEIIEGLCKKPGYVLEAGWPNAGSANGKAVPGVDQQKTAIKSIEQSEPGKVVIFSYRNDRWKQPGPFNVEQNFGCGDLF